MKKKKKEGRRLPLFGYEFAVTDGNSNVKLMFTKLRSSEKTFKSFPCPPLLLEVKAKEMRLRNDGWVKKRQFMLLKNGSGWLFQKCLINVCKNQEQFLGKELTLRNNNRKTILNKLLKFST